MFGEWKMLIAMGMHNLKLNYFKYVLLYVFYEFSKILLMTEFSILFYNFSIQDIF